MATESRPDEGMATWNGLSKARTLVSDVFGVAVLTIGGSLLLKALFPLAIWNWISLHSLTETLGMYASLAVAIILLLIRKETDRRHESGLYVCAASGLIGMGILDGFHACVAPGNTFVWLHTLSLLVGGALFGLVWLRNGYTDSPKAWILPIATAVLAIAIGIFSLVYPASLPLLISGGRFTRVANNLNVIGGLLFIFATLRFAIGFLSSPSALDRLFVNFAVLNGAAGLLFPFSEAWSPDWWFWHILRAVACLVLFGVVFVTMRSIEDLRTALADRIRADERLRAVLKELTEGTTVLSTAASEITATVSQVASSAAETATAVSETSTTAEEVKRTAHLSNQKAKAVQESAQKATVISETGSEAVSDTLECMNGIRMQMELIAETVVRLSEQGQAIGEIIAVVNDLAEQSNLLAVNAAIEATRAGEYGKGFCVVAQEMKNLAEQSRQATMQVRTILMEVQKATSTAVLATEQGTKAVALGVKQAGDAGESIDILMRSVGEAAQAAIQIAASSQQQLVGMDQIALAISNIKQATTQNVSGTKQLEASALGLHELGVRLMILVDRQHIEA